MRLRHYRTSAPRCRPPKVSVLIKSYNHASYVRRCLESVLEQSFHDFEIIVTDDASADGTLDVLRSFYDSRISLAAFEENQGLSSAMNATIARATGEYVAILNSDDWALPDRLARQAAFLDANPGVAAVFGRPLVVDERGQPRNTEDVFAPLAHIHDFDRASWLKRFFYHGNCLCAPTAMIRRAVLEEVGLYDRRLTNLQDFDFWIRMLVAGLNIHVLALPALTAFRIRDGQRNMSAPRDDSLLRSEFEFAQILGHYLSLDEATLTRAFRNDLDNCPHAAGAPLPMKVAELALTVPRASHRLFALETIHANARQKADFDRLRELAGSLDPFGLLAPSRVAHEAAEAGDGPSVNQAQAHGQPSRDTEDLLAMIRAYEESTSWRVTWPMRSLAAHVPHRWRRLGRRGLQSAWLSMTPLRPSWWRDTS